jgi:hypothetical protein
MIRSLLITTALLSLSGCNWIGRQADAVGSHMPVIGERCEHWQCITSSGRQRSDMYKMQAQQPQEDQTEQPAQQQVLTPEQQYQGQYQQQYQGQYQQPYQGQPYPQQQAPAPAPTSAPDPINNPYDYYNE